MGELFKKLKKPRGEINSPDCNGPVVKKGVRGNG